MATVSPAARCAFRISRRLGLKPDPGAKLVGNLTPLALSFLAGYSVEVLFSAMDKIVNAFGSVSQAVKG